MPIGLKLCPKCESQMGARANKCPNAKCGHDFKKIRQKKSLGISKVKPDFDWQTLKRGDEIKVVAGSGPHWKLLDGRTESMGYHGVFKVLYVDATGIHAHSKEEGGHSYIYMGPTRTDNDKVLQSHKISFVRIAVND
jgi:ribosomal protein L40E